MKKFINIILLALIVLCGFNSCEDKSLSGTATYYGVVMDENTDMPFAGVDVKVTNGEKIHTATKTSDDGSFSVQVQLSEIDKDYYLLIGNSRMETKKVDFPSYGNGSFNVGTIVVKGPSAPTVVTKEVTNIKSKVATGGGKVTSSGGYAVTRRGVCWSTSQYPTVANDHTEDGSGMGDFMSNISNLQPRTTYYVRAYAENEKGIAYGNQVYFTTESGVPTVQTKLVRVDGKTSVFCEGTITDQGDSPVTARGICWGTSTPTISGKKTSDGEGTGGFSTSVTVTNVHSSNLYFRAYATNSSGTAYGETIMIDQRNPYQLPTVTEGSVTWLILPYDLHNANMGGSYNSNFKTPSYSGNTAYTSCADLVAYDYSDWELPTRSTLELIYCFKDEIGGFANQKYWTSSYSHENYDHYYYYYVNFANGVTGTDYSESLGVRPVRKY